MSNLLYTLLLIPVITTGQSVYTLGGQPLTYGGQVLTAPSPEFDLTYIDTLTLALIDDYEYMTLEVSGSDSLVTAWADIYNRYQATQSTSARKMVWSADSGLRSDNGPNYLEITTPNVVYQDVTMYIVVRSENINGEYATYISGPNTVRYSVYKTSNEPGVRLLSGNNVGSGYPATHTFNYSLLTAVWGTTDSLFFNADLKLSANAGSYTTDDIYIGNSPAIPVGQGPFDGYIRSFIIVPNNASATVSGITYTGTALREQIHNYLNNRYNLY